MGQKANESSVTWLAWVCRLLLTTIPLDGGVPSTKESQQAGSSRESGACTWWRSSCVRSRYGAVGFDLVLFSSSSFCARPLRHITGVTVLIKGGMLLPISGFMYAKVNRCKHIHTYLPSYLVYQCMRFGALSIEVNLGGVYNVQKRIVNYYLLSLRETFFFFLKKKN